MNTSLILFLLFSLQLHLGPESPGCGSARSLGHLSMGSLGLNSAVLPPLGAQRGGEEMPPAMPLQMAGGSIYQPFNRRPFPLNVPPGVLPMPMPWMPEWGWWELLCCFWQTSPGEEGPNFSPPPTTAKRCSFILELGWEVKRKGDLEEGMNSPR